MNAVEAREYIEQLESALIDILDGQSEWHDITEQTGLSDERAKEIAELYNEKVCPNYHQKHGLTENEN